MLMFPPDVGTICCILTHPSDEGHRGSFNVKLDNCVPADGLDFTCSMANCSLKLAGLVLPVEPREVLVGVLVGVCALDIVYPSYPPVSPPKAVAATILQLPLSLNSLTELEVEAADKTAIP